jgi:hypothetical protein
MQKVLATVIATSFIAVGLTTSATSAAAATPEQDCVATSFTATSWSPQQNILERKFDASGPPPGTGVYYSALEVTLNGTVTFECPNTHGTVKRTLNGYHPITLSNTPPEIIKFVSGSIPDPIVPITVTANSEMVNSVIWSTPTGSRSCEYFYKVWNGKQWLTQCGGRELSSSTNSTPLSSPIYRTIHMEVFDGVTVPLPAWNSTALSPAPAWIAPIDPVISVGHFTSEGKQAIYAFACNPDRWTTGRQPQRVSDPGSCMDVFYVQLQVLTGGQWKDTEAQQTADRAGWAPTNGTYRVLILPTEQTTWDSATSTAKTTMVPTAPITSASIRVYNAPPTATPTPSATAAPTSTSTNTAAAKKRVYVKQPTAVPGRFCKSTYRGKYTKTAKYGVLKCKGTPRARWKKA